MSGNSFLPFMPPYIRSCKKESEIPIEGELKGEIPNWLKGHLIRIGSGLLEVGPDRYNHIFDGLALMHRFSFQDGKVTYFNKFLRSDTYRRNMKANRIIVNEFATPGVPDPCKTIFQRFTSLFNVEDYTDNDLVNIILYADEAYACSETNSIWKIDPQTLNSVEKVHFSRTVPVNAAIAHAHNDTDGTVYNVGSTYSLIRPHYKILKFPPKENKSDNTFEKASVVCDIPSSKLFNISYHHSFAMTENYFIFVEQPLYLCVPQVAFTHFFGGKAYADALSWNENQPTRFHVVRRSDGQILDTVYLAKSFFVFHHINSYEEDNHLIVDMCTYDKAHIVNALYVKALEDLFNNSSQPTFDGKSQAKRYVLPLSVNVENSKDNTNLVKLPNSTSTAVKSKDGSIFCTPETLTDSESWCPELPRINYEKFNGRQYRYFYAMSSNDEAGKTYLIKVDVEKKSTINWTEDGVVVSEPVFVQEPDSVNEDEDSGVLLASLLFANDERKVALLVLNAKTMKEVGRATFSTKSSVPATFHGTFITNQNYNEIL